MALRLKELEDAHEAWLISEAQKNGRMPLPQEGKFLTPETRELFYLSATGDRAGAFFCPFCFLLSFSKRRPASDSFYIIKFWLRSQMPELWGKKPSCSRLKRPAPSFYNDRPVDDNRPGKKARTLVIELQRGNEKKLAENK